VVPLALGFYVAKMQARGFIEKPSNHCLAIGMQMKPVEPCPSACMLKKLASLRERIKENSA